jgi:hypothetical protein
MFMGRVNRISRYKHGITRTYLNLDDEGRCYVVGERGECTLADWEEELRKLEAALSSLGASLTTAYDDAFIERKRKSLQQQGIALLTIKIEPRESNIH